MVLALIGGSSNPTIPYRVRKFKKDRYSPTPDDLEPGFVDNIAKYLHIRPTDCVAEPFSSGEPRVQVLDNVRNMDVVLIQSIGRNISGCSTNYYFMELLTMIDACKRSNARSITVVIPFYPYARQDKKDQPRVPITAKLVANMIEMAGATRVITMDLHAAQIQGFFNIPVDNIYAINLMVSYLRDFVTAESHILISPDNGGVKRIEAYAEKLKIKYLIMHKSRDHTLSSVVHKSTLIGDTEGIESMTGVIVDDMIDTGGTMVRGIEELMRFGIKSFILVITHGVLSGPAVERLMGCDAIKEVVVTNTLPMDCFPEFTKLKVIDVSSLFGDILDRIRTGSSVSELFA